LRNISVKMHRLATFSFFFMNGALAATWVSRIPTIQEKLGITEGVLGFVLLGFSIGLLVALVLVSEWINRSGSKKVVLASSIAACIALPLLGIFSHPILLFIGLIIFGASLSAMDVSMNEQAVLVERRTGKPIMSSFHAGYSIGGVAGALFGSLMAGNQSQNTMIQFLIISAIFSIAAFALYSNFQSTDVTRKKESKKTTIQFPERAVWVLGIIALASTFGEGAAADWSAVFIQNELGATASSAALGFAAFSLTMTGGRIFGDWLMRILKPSRVVRMGGFLAGLGFFLAAWSNQPWLAIAGFGMVGLGLANVIPTLFSTAGNLSGINPGTGIAGVATIGYAGFLFGPPLVGTIAEIFSLREALSIIAVIMMTLILSGRSLIQKNENENI